MCNPRKSSAIVLSCLSYAISSPEPFQVDWNNVTSFGPDGPWQAVSIAIGTKTASFATGSLNSTVNLYPGGWWGHTILTTAVCNSSTTSCPASDAGLYSPSDSSTADTKSWPAQVGVDQWDGQKAMNLSGIANTLLDIVTITSLGSPYSIPQSIIAAVKFSQVRLPDNSYYSTQVGFLSLGATDFVQRFYPNNNSTLVANLIPGWLRQHDSILSNSWGLHIGSVLQSQKGSLVFGGFDQSRVLGPVGTFDTTNTGGVPIVALFDIIIGVVTGGSPFHSPIGGSLFHANGNITVPVVVNPTVPYIYLPFGTCEAIAAYLPLTWQAGIGLYTWNTDDPQYQRVISSPAYLGFIFQLSDLKNLTIKVPFALLNLTLDKPIVTRPQAYFPCKPTSSSNGEYYLGRAFLQAAFIGMNWETYKFFMAQAPGPDIGDAQVQSIQRSDTSIASNPLDGFADSWARKWTNKIALPSGTAVSSSTATDGLSAAKTSSVLDPGTSNGAMLPISNSGLSAGAKIGIGVGSGIGGLALIGAVFFTLMFSRTGRLRSRNDPPKVIPGLNDDKTHEMGDSEKVHEAGPSEIRELGSITL